MLSLSYLSLTAITTLSAGAFFITLVALLCEYPANSSPLTLRIWSPNRRPPRAAAEPDLTKHTNTPCGRKNYLLQFMMSQFCHMIWYESHMLLTLLMASTHKPTLPSPPLHSVTSLTPCLISARRIPTFPAPEMGAICLSLAVAAGTTAPDC